MRQVFKYIFHVTFLTRVIIILLNHDPVFMHFYASFARVWGSNAYAKNIPIQSILLINETEKRYSFWSMKFSTRKTVDSTRTVLN